MRNPNQHECISKVVTYLLAITFLIVSSASAAQAAPGDLDPTFGTGGILTDWSGQALSAAIDPNGKIVVVGNSTPYPWDLAVARYNSDGSPDVTFGNAGKVSRERQPLLHTIVIILKMRRGYVSLFNSNSDPLISSPHA